MKCRYCDSENLVKTEIPLGQTYDYIGKDGCYHCLDCHSSLGEKIKITENFLLDYLSLCDRYNLYIQIWGHCEGPALDRDNNHEDFIAILIEEINNIKNRTIKYLKENRQKETLH